MKTNQVSTNHVELVGTANCGHSLLACFSYGRLAVLQVGGTYLINLGVWKYSTSTSRHINSTFPELKGIDINQECGAIHKAVDDDQMDKLSTFLISASKEAWISGLDFGGVR